MKKIKKIKVSEGLIEQYNEIGNLTFSNDHNIKELYFSIVDLQKKINEIIDFVNKFQVINLIDNSEREECLFCKKRGYAFFHSSKEFHCKNCGMKGFPSVYGNGGICTACANIEGISSGRIKLWNKI